MSLHFWTDLISQTSRGIAKGIFIVGLLLIGFGIIIAAFPEIFAFLAAAVFFIAGAGCGIMATRIFLAQRRLDKLNSDDSKAYRNNVQIHTEEHYDL